MSNSMTWGKLLTPKSVIKDLSTEGGRSPFVKDQDKIIFSWAFRRMSRKTQVHPMAINDHVHNRLTHSIEVACVGRSLGDMVADSLSSDLQNGLLPANCDDLGEIVRAACLAHDIGNPPFGHAGESAIQSWAEQQGEWKLSEDLLNDLKSFDGNAMGFRVLTHIEYHTNDGGMRLSYPTLASMMKYPWTAKQLEPGKKKFCCLAPEAEALKGIAETLGLIKIDEGKYSRHPLSYLVEAADDICYSLLDIEDAFQLSLISEEDFYNICREMDSKSPLDLYGYVEEAKSKNNIDSTKRMAFFRGLLVEHLIKDSANAFCMNYRDIMKGEFKHKDLLSACKDHSIKVIQNAKKLCIDKVYNHYRKVEVEIGSYSCIKSILDLFYEATLDIYESNKNTKDGEEILKKFSFKTQRVIALTKMTFELYTNAKEIQGASKIMYFFLDYLAGMTDNYATHLGKQFNGQGGI